MYRIGDRAGTVLARNNDGSGYGIRVTGYGKFFILSRFQVRTDAFEVRRYTGFHLNLHLTVSWIDVVKQFLTGLTRVCFYLVIEVFRDMNQIYDLTIYDVRFIFRRPQPQVIQSCELVLGVHLCDQCFQFGGVPQQHATEIKIIAQCTDLIINHRGFGNGPLSIVTLYFIKVVGIDHVRAGHFQHLYHTFLSQIHPFDLGFETDHGVRSVCFLSNLFDRLCRAYSAR